MDSQDLEYEFSQAKHVVGKRLTKKPKHEFWAMYLPLYALTIVAGMPHDFMDADMDDQVTAQTVEVQAQFQEQLNSLSPTSDAADQKQFVTDLLLADDLSEEQAGDFLDAFKKNVDQNFAGYEIGDIGDLRESRAAHPDDAEAIAQATVAAEDADRPWLLLDFAFALLFLGWAVGRGSNALFRKSKTLQRWADDTPRHPRFKH